MLKFLNHASFIIEHEGTSLLSDPYLAGTSFNDGWRLLVEEEHQDLDQVDYIWFSHEHPDHFSVPFLRAIPEERRSSITVLYQETRDGRVKSFCNRLGYQVTELADGVATELAPGFTVTCGRIPFYDSWLLIDAGGLSILNTNDCILESPERLDLIRRQVDRCDVLFTQFSYANWNGSRDDDEARRTLAEEKLRRIGIQCEAFRPRHVVPFASYVYFCHQENAYMNSWINTVHRCAEYIQFETGATPIVLAPNESWDGRSPKTNTASLQYWQDRYGELRRGELPQLQAGASIEPERLRAASEAMQARVADRNYYGLLRALVRLGLLPTTVFEVTDLERMFSFDWRQGLVELDGPPTKQDLVVSLHSESLLFLFEWDYGVDTLNVNARFDGTIAAKKAMIRNFGVLSLNNTGRYLNVRSTGSFLNPGFLKQGLRTTGLVRQPAT